MPAVAEVSFFEYKQAAKLMGNRFEITVVGSNEGLARKRIALAIGEIRRIEKLLTTLDEDSLINEINRQAGIQPVQVGVKYLNW